MRKIFTFILALIASVGTIFAETTASGTCGASGNNLTWTLNDGVFTISGTGGMADWGSKAAVPWYSYRTSIQTVEVEAGVTSIGNHAFDGISVEKVFLSEGLLTIGQAAFQDCDNLTSLSIPSTVTKVNNDAFDACANLTQLVFYPLAPPTIIGWVQALQLQKQTTIYIPDDAYDSGAYSEFWGTGNYTYKQMAANKVQVGDLWYHFNMCRKEAQVRSGEYTFSSITIPSSADYNGDSYPVTSIGVAAFRDCTKLKSVVLSEGMTEIGDGAFMGSAVTSVVLPSTLTSIASYAFASRKSGELTVTSYAEAAPECGANCFYGLDASKSKLNVPAAGYNAYKNDAAWSAFTTIVAMDVIQGPFTFKVDVEAKTAALTAYDNSASQTAIIIPNTLILGGETYAVTSIKEYVFSGNTTIKSVVIPDNVSNIGLRAFEGCTALSEVKLPATAPSIVGSSCFYKCNSLPVIDGIRYADYLLIEPTDKTKSTYTIKSNTRLIDSYAFRMCENLTSIVLPNTVEKIGSYAFNGCTSLVSVVLPDGLAELPNQVFSECTSLSSITIPKTVQKIDQQAFANCSSLQHIELSEGLKTIGWRAFTKCSSLQQIDLPEGLEEIGGQAFHRCAALKKCTIPSTVQKMTKGEYMEIPGEEDYQTFVSTFSKCDALDTIVILSKTIGEAAYLSQYFDWYIPNYVLGENIEKVGHNAFTGTVDLNSVQLSSSIKTICKAAFSGQYALPEIDLRNVTTIEDSAFYWAIRLEHITLNHVEAIGKGAFVYTPLKELHLPACLKTIGERAFSNCLSLQSITCEATEPPVLGDQCFSYSQVKDIPVYVPAKSVTAYRKATGWKEFNNYQVFQTPLRYEFRDDNLTATVIKYEEGTPYCGDVVIPSTVEHDGKTYTVTTIGRNAFFDCTELTSISIPPTVQNIYTDAFWGCTNLQAVHISDLSKWCTIHFSFEDAPALHAHPLTYSQQLLLNDDVITDLVIPDEATAVNPYAFANDTALESVTFPASMTVIQTGAFKGCKNIKTITCYAEEVPFANTYTFDGIDKKIPVYVPAESVDAYKDADYWNDFENILPLPQRYQLVDLSAESIKAGKYIIVFDDNKAHAKVDGKDLIASSDALTIKNDVVFVPYGTVCDVTISSFGTDSFSILLPDGTSYLDLQEKNSITTSATASGFAITDGGSKTVKIAKYLQSENKTFVLRRNGTYFRLYNNDNYPLPKLYRKIMPVYTVRFVDWDGTELKKEKVESGMSATAPKDPTRGGHRFTGWDKAFDHITASLTITAQYEAIDYTPTNLKADVVPQGDDVLITLSWDKAEDAGSYELRVEVGGEKLFSQNTKGLNVLAIKLSVIETMYKIDPGTYTMNWFVRSTDLKGNVLSDWATGPSFEITIKDTGTGVENVQSDKVQGTKVIENGVLYIIYNGTKYNVL